MWEGAGHGEEQPAASCGEDVLPPDRGGKPRRFRGRCRLRVLLLDLDVQPTLSSYYPLRHRAPGGIYELPAFNERRIEQVVSHTSIAGLDLVLSNDDRGELNTLLLHAPDGRLRLRK